jgi:hypothetical protein
MASTQVAAQPHANIEIKARCGDLAQIPIHTGPGSLP